MVTIKKRGGKSRPPWTGWVLLLAVAAGCSPPGVKDLLEGDRLLREQKYHDAIKPLQKATALLPNNALAWNQLGYVQHHSGFPDGADTAYRRALALNPNLAAARWNLGCLCLELNRPADAALHLGSVALLDPKNPDYQLMHAIALVRAGKAEEAERLFKNYLAVQGAQADAMNGLAIAQWLRNRPQDAAATLQNVLQVSPTHRPATLNLAILYHTSLHNKPQALKLYQRYLSYSPEPPFRAQVAQVARSLEAELQAAAVTNVTQAPPTPPGPPVTPAVPATVHATNPPVARTSLVATTAPPPTAPPRTNRPAAAETTPPTSRPPSPGPTSAPPAATVVSTPPAEAPPPPPPGAARRYTYLRPPKPPAGDRAQAMTHYQAGEEARQAQRWAEAQKHYEAAIKADGTLYEAHIMLGRMALENRDLPRALAAYEQALALQPEAAGARFNFALALHQAGFAGDAVEEFERFYAAQPQETNGRMYVANIYLQELHDTAKARAHYQRLLELQPNHPQAAAIREWLRQHP